MSFIMIFVYSEIGTSENIFYMGKIIQCELAEKIENKADITDLFKGLLKIRRQYESRRSYRFIKKCNVFVSIIEIYTRGTTA